MEAAPIPEKPQSRREFAANLILGAGPILGLGSLAWRFLEYLYPVIPPIKWVEVPAGKPGDIPRDSARLLRLQAGPVLLENDGGQIRALSAVCTHLGCIVQWDATRRQFTCPCHHGVYDFSGKVVSGPPPRPLEPLQVKLRNDQIFVVMKELSAEGQA